jgi:putative membrane protein
MMKVFFSGLIVGIANIVPGLSGGTMLVVSGLFEQVLQALKQPFKHLSFLVPLALGVIVGLISFSFVVDWLFGAFYIPTIFFFMGIVIGGALLFYQHELPNQKDFLIAPVLLGLMLVLSLDFIPTSDSPSLVLLLIAGFIAGGTMILPGLSGALIFLILGQYELVLDYIISIFEFDLVVLLTLFGLVLSVVSGIFAMAFVVTSLLKTKRKLMINIILGLLLGSVYQMTPTPPLDLWWFSAILTLPAGMWVGSLFYKEKRAMH